MRQSKLFSKIRRVPPKDETAKNAQLLIRAGYIHKEMAGVYDYLPLGLRVIEKVKQIVREEMNAVGGNELLMSSLQRKEVWEKTDRWDDKNVDIWFKSQLANGSAVGLGWSHEEPITDMMTNHITSYRDLPVCVYQFQNKLRNELRAKSGLMRGREFLMKDMYSYSPTEDAHKAFYDEARAAYHQVFERLGIGDRTYYTFASGGAFTQFSHEFQTLSDAGEDTIYVDKEKKLAINEEVLSDDVLKQVGLKREDLEKAKAAEVGNIFGFGTTKSEELGLSYTDETGKKQYVVLGSYGIGITRVIGVIVELMSDDKGLLWPKAIAPFRVHVLALTDDSSVTKAADEAYELLMAAGVEVLLDDRKYSSPGEKLATADLLGMPYRVVVSKKTLEEGKLEVTSRADGDMQMLELRELIRKLAEEDKTTL